MRRLFGYILAVMLAAVVCALLFGALMNIAPGLFLVLPFLGCWWAKPLPTFEDELKALLKEAQ